MRVFGYYLLAIERREGPVVNFALGRRDQAGPAAVGEAIRRHVLGDPGKERLSASRVERRNLTMPVRMRRLTRVNTASSERWEDVWSALCVHVHFCCYNLLRVHWTLRLTPAMEAGTIARACNIEDVLEAEA